MKLSFCLSELINTHNAKIINTWQIEPIVSITTVTDSVLNISLGAGTANYMKLGIIIIKKTISPQTSNPILYFFNMIFTP